jgi:serine/threonine protein kinase
VRAEGALLATGDVVADRYEIRRMLGEGGMGQVYEAVHRLTRRPVALKVLRPEYARSAEVVMRFIREAHAAAAIADHHVVDVLDMGQLSDRGEHYLVLELLTGCSLAELLRREGTLPIDRALHIARQLATVIGKAHRGTPRIIHRDLKPENVFLVERDGDRDFVKVLDFGIAKLLDDPTEGDAPVQLTLTAHVLGTPLYMPAEQLRSSRTIDERADVYAMGVILYEMLSGRVPLAGASLAEQFYLLMSEPITPLRALRSDVDEPLSALVARCLARDPDERPRDGSALADALDRFISPRTARPSVPLEPALAETLSALPSGAMNSPPGTRSAEASPVVTVKPARRTKPLVTAALIGGVALVLGGLAARSRIPPSSTEAPTPPPQPVNLPVTEDDATTRPRPVAPADASNMVDLPTAQPRPFPSHAPSRDPLRAGRPRPTPRAEAGVPTRPFAAEQ